MRIARLLFFVGLAAAAIPAAAQSRVYCCTDSEGRRMCGDTLPMMCYNRAYREVTPGGRVIREVEAPLTAEQRHRRDLEVKAQREKLAREAEAKRRDQVLMDSYANVKEIDARRDREISIIDAELKRARGRETELLADRTKLEKLKPPTGQIPRELAEDLVVVSSELTAIRSVIDSKQRDIDLIRSRFEADRKRFIDLSQKNAASGDKAVQ